MSNYWKKEKDEVEIGLNNLVELFFLSVLVKLQVRF